MRHPEGSRFSGGARDDTVDGLPKFSCVPLRLERRAECVALTSGFVYPEKRRFDATLLPSPSLQHVGFVQGADGEAFHRSLQVFADFE
jgi:hypothetical protein